MKTRKPVLKVCIATVAGMLVVCAAAQANTFSLDDNPSAPLTPPLGPTAFLGFGAEDPFGLGLLPGPLAPSPSLGLGFRDGDLLGPGPVLRLRGPRDYVNAISDRFDGSGVDPRLAKMQVVLKFSVDRVSMGLPGTAVNAEALAFEQPGDIYEATSWFSAPRQLVGALAGGLGYVGAVGVPGVGGNVLDLDEAQLSLVAPPSPPQPGSHDNVDGYDCNNGSLFGPQAMTVTDWLYFSVAPDLGTAIPGAVSAAEIWNKDPSFGFVGLYATAAALGLDLFGINTDDIDALVIGDMGTDAELGGQPIGPLAEPGKDWALFSLAPGSASLAQYGLSPADIFFTDFTGRFALYASAADLGLLPEDNVDALEMRLVPEPLTMLSIFAGTAGLAGYLRKRRSI